MRVAVMGAGAVGGYFGARLAAAGTDVTFIARGEHLKAMQTRGLRVHSLRENLEIPSAFVSSSDQIAPVDLVRLMGWTFPRAEEEATRLMVDYGGEPEVTDDGVVVYAFKALRKTAGPATEMTAPGWASERLEPTPPLTGNEPGTNALIGAFNGFNLLAPFWICLLYTSDAADE